MEVLRVLRFYGSLNRGARGMVGVLYGISGKTGLRNSTDQVKKV